MWFKSVSDYSRRIGWEIKRVRNVRGGWQPGEFGQVEEWSIRISWGVERVSIQLRESWGGRLSIVSRKEARAALTTAGPNRSTVKIFLVGYRLGMASKFLFFFQQGKETNTLIELRAEGRSTRGWESLFAEGVFCFLSCLRAREVWVTKRWEGGGEGEI